LVASFWDISYYPYYLISFIIFCFILPQKLTFQKKIGVKEIFEDNNNWEQYKNANLEKLDKWLIKNVEKMLKCKDPRFGYLKYQCGNCNEIKIIKFSCNSRIYSRCGKRYTDQWSRKLHKNYFRFLIVILFLQFHLNYGHCSKRIQNFGKHYWILLKSHLKKV